MRYIKADNPLENPAVYLQNFNFYHNKNMIDIDWLFYKLVYIHNLYYI
ncbi:MAG: hypothetical protein RLZZ46_1577 [Bacteroidota bacterium]